MWTMLRGEPFKAWHFRRQMPIGPYYVDFVSVKVKLVVEIDGSQHYEDDAIAYDARRTVAIEKLGYRVLRFATTDIMHHLGSVRAVLSGAGLGFDNRLKAQITRTDPSVCCPAVAAAATTRCG
jgi:very-short-patch-repair endonuclease